MNARCSLGFTLNSLAMEVKTKARESARPVFHTTRNHINDFLYLSCVLYFVKQGPEGLLYRFSL